MLVIQDVCFIEVVISTLSVNIGSRTGLILYKFFFDKKY